MLRVFGPGGRLCDGVTRREVLRGAGLSLFGTVTPLPFLTGYTDGEFLAQARPSDPPDVGAVCQYLGLGPRDLPGAVCLPCYPGEGEKWKRRGPYGGFLGGQYDPLFARCQPTFAREPKVPYYDPVLPVGEPLLPSVDALPEITIDRFQARRSLLAQLDDAFTRAETSSSIVKLDKVRQRAFAMLT